MVEYIDGLPSANYLICQAWYGSFTYSVPVEKSVIRKYWNLGLLMVNPNFRTNSRVFHAIGMCGSEYRLFCRTYLEGDPGDRMDFKTMKRLIEKLRGLTILVHFEDHTISHAGISRYQFDPTYVERRMGRQSTMFTSDERDFINPKRPGVLRFRRTNNDTYAQSDLPESDICPVGLGQTASRQIPSDTDGRRRTLGNC